MPSSPDAPTGSGPSEVEARLADVQARFDTFDDYDDFIRRCAPGYEEMQDIFEFLISRHDLPVRRVLDLGIGTGSLVARLLVRLPAAEFVGVDFSPGMLEMARARLGRVAERVTLVEADLRDFPDPGPVNVVVSALAVHHLENPDKRTLFARLAGLLPPGGLFLLGDIVVMPTARTQETVRALWRADMEKTCEGTDIDPENVLASQAALDRPATVADQVSWLTTAGFREVATVWQRYTVAVILAIR